jgi:small subunit ribosomal protein S9
MAVAKKEKSNKKTSTKKNEPKKSLLKKTSKTSKASVKKTSKKASSKKISSGKEPVKKKTGQYYEAVGRRKKAIARVRLFTCRPFEDEKGRIIVNQKPYTEFFPTFELQQTVLSPLQKMKSVNRFEVSAKVYGGGIRGQAEAIRHGLARALVKFNPDFSKKLKRAGYLTRDPRKKERKKPGLKKARRAPQWRKR